MWLENGHDTLIEKHSGKKKYYSLYESFKFSTIFVPFYFPGFKKLLGNRVYEGEVSFLPSTDKENHPRDSTRCRAG